MKWIKSYKLFEDRDISLEQSKCSSVFNNLFEDLGLISDPVKNGIKIYTLLDNYSLGQKIFETLANAFNKNSRRVECVQKDGKTSVSLYILFDKNLTSISGPNAEDNYFVPPAMTNNRIYKVPDNEEAILKIVIERLRQYFIDDIDSKVQIQTSASYTGNGLAPTTQIYTTSLFKLIMVRYCEHLLYRCDDLYATKNTVKRRQQELLPLLYKIVAEEISHDKENSYKIIHGLDKQSDLYKGISKYLDNEILNSAGKMGEMGF